MLRYEWKRLINADYVARILSDMSVGRSIMKVMVFSFVSRLFLNKVFQIIYVSRNLTLTQRRKEDHQHWRDNVN